MYRLVKFFSLVLILSDGVYSKECGDCVLFDQCPNALELALHKRTPETAQLFRKAFCGLDNYKINVPKVCCSEFSSTIQETPEDQRIANHTNFNLLPAECGDIKGDRYVGGQIANLYEFPWMALISHETRDGFNFKCSGSIINKRYILTAAHCVKNKKIAGVRVGEYDLSTDVDCQKGVCEKHIQDIPLDTFVIHENYRGLPMVVNDIALLRLGEDIDFNHRNVHRVCLPTTTQLRRRSLSNALATVTGWGFTENDMESSVLLKVNIPIHTAEHCSELYNRFSKRGDPDVTAEQLCAGTQNKDSCNGDSGGPLMLEELYNNIYRYVQYGVVSHGPQKCGSDNPGVYTDVTKYMGWILDNIAP